MVELEIEQDDERMHQHQPQQAVPQMPGIAGPDPFQDTPLDQLAKDGVDTIADTAQESTPCGSSITRGPAIGCQQRQPGVAKLRGQRRTPVVAVAHHEATRLLNQRRQQRQIVDIRRRYREAGNHPGPGQTSMQPKAIERLPGNDILAVGGLLGEASATLSTRKLTDGYGETIDDGQLRIMGQQGEQQLPQVLFDRPQIGRLADKGGAVDV
jgi:hypothetical protein